MWRCSAPRCAPRLPSISRPSMTGCRRSRGGRRSFPISTRSRRSGPFPRPPPPAIFWPGSTPPPCPTRLCAAISSRARSAGRTEPRFSRGFNASMIALQNFIFPEPEICTEMPLYAHVAGPVGFSTSERHFWLGQGGVLSFDSYFNLFNLEKWAGACVLDGLWAEVSGQGRVEIRVWQALDQQSWNIIQGEMAVLAKDSPYRIDLAAALAAGRKGLLFVEIRGLDPDGATITGGRFATGGVPGELPRLAVSITTFKREAQVRETVARLTDFLDRFEFGDRLHVQVVDNGQSAEIAESDRVSVIENANYGGAGGFARGLLEAEAKGFSHCLFMDDDASFQMENIARAYL